MRVAVAASQQPGGRALPWQAAEQARVALEERLKTVADELHAKATQAEQRVADAKAAAQRTAELEALLQAPPAVPSCPGDVPCQASQPRRRTRSLARITARLQLKETNRAASDGLIAELTAKLELRVGQTARGLAACALAALPRGRCSDGCQLCSSRDGRLCLRRALSAMLACRAAEL